MKRILITGGAGFIGSHVAELFLAQGYEVVVIDDLSSGKRSNLPPSVALHVVDVASTAAADLVTSGGFTVVAHLAAQMDVRKSVLDPTFDARVNILGTLNLLERLRALPEDRRPRFIFASTGGALYGEFPVFPTPETTAANPDSPYGVAKLAAELYLGYYARVWHIDATVLRFGNVYGPRQDPHGDAGVIAIFAKRLLEGSPLTVYGDGAQTRDYIFVADVAAAFLAVANAERMTTGPLEARAFNIGTGVETSVLDLAHAMAAAAKLPATIHHAPERRGELARSLLDPAKASRILGWRAKTPLNDGLRMTLGWVKTQR